MIKSNLLLAICLVVSLFACAQSKKEVRENKIKSLTVWKAETGDDATKGFKESVEEWDRAGRLILKIEYKSDGTVGRKQTTRYDIYGNVTEETYFNLKDGIDEKKVYKYNARNDKTEEILYNNADGSVTKKTTYTYNQAGFKTTEMVYDGSGNLKEKSVYTYNKKGLKDTKQNYNTSGGLKAARKYIYEYF